MSSTPIFRLQTARIAKSTGGLITLMGLWALTIRWFSFDIHLVDFDEALYLLQGKAWLAGHPPYTAIWDVKPPGLLAIYAILAGFGNGLLASRIASFIAIWATSVQMTRFGLNRLKSGSWGWLGGLLYAPCVNAIQNRLISPELLLAPLVIFAFSLTDRVTRNQTENPRFSLCVIGLLFGAASLIKQTSVFEAAAAALLIARTSAPAIKPLMARLAHFSLSAASLYAVYLFYGLAVHAPSPFYTAPFIYAVGRLNADPAPLQDNLLHFLLMLKPVFPLVLCGLPLIGEWRIMRQQADRRAINLLLVWLVASCSAIIAAHSLYDNYFIPLLPPLILLACRALQAATTRFPARRPACAAIATALLAYPLAWDHLFTKPLLYKDIVDQQIIEALQENGYHHDDLIYVADYDPRLYLLSGGRYPTRYIFTPQLLCNFSIPTDKNDEINHIFDQNPSFIVIRKDKIFKCEQKESLEKIRFLMKENYKILTHIRADYSYVDIFKRQDHKRPRGG